MFKISEEQKNKQNLFFRKMRILKLIWGVYLDCCACDESDSFYSLINWK